MNDDQKQALRLLWSNVREAYQWYRQETRTTQCEDHVADARSDFVACALAYLATKRAFEAVERLEGKTERLLDWIEWYRMGYREMTSWSNEVAAERTYQYSRDTLSGPNAEELSKARRSRVERQENLDKQRERATTYVGRHPDLPDSATRTTGPAIMGNTTNGDDE